MRVITPGHKHGLRHLDGRGEEILTYVQRTGDGYPGNLENHEGTNCQEVLRSLIERFKYLDGQISDARNGMAIAYARSIIRLLEDRAAERHGRALPQFTSDIELMPTCSVCGHIGCDGNIHSAIEEES